MSNYDNANARYQTALAELERLTAAAEAAPQDPAIAAAAQAAYDAAQSAYAEVLVAFDAQNAVVDPGVSEPVPEAVISSMPGYDLSPLPGDPQPTEPVDPQPAYGAQPSSAPYIPATMPGSVAAPAAAPAPVGTVGASTEYLPLSAPPLGIAEYGAPATDSLPVFGTAADQLPPGGVVLTRRASSTRFTPSDVPLDDLVPIQRGLLAANNNGRKPEIGRARTIAGNLPEWSPLPPGEIVALGRRP